MANYKVTRLQENAVITIGISVQLPHGPVVDTQGNLPHIFNFSRPTSTTISLPVREPVAQSDFSTV
jgi:hypothetical protein